MCPARHLLLGRRVFLEEFRHWFQTSSRMTAASDANEPCEASLNHERLAVQCQQMQCQSSDRQIEELSQITPKPVNQEH